MVMDKKRMSHLEGSIFAGYYVLVLHLFKLSSSLLAEVSQDEAKIKQQVDLILLLIGLKQILQVKEDV